MQQRLDAQTFQTVVAYTPLISIDLIIENHQDQVLLGQRLNKPAQHYWFVPGGRILKDETMAQAFARLTKMELGIELQLSQAELIGPFEHFYSNNYFNDQFTTHYVVLGYRIKCELNILTLPDEQHGKYKWFDKAGLIDSNDVHLHTKLYFQ